MQRFFHLRCCCCVPFCCDYASKIGKTNKESPFLSTLPHGRSAEGNLVAEFSHDADFLSNPRSSLFLFLLRAEVAGSCALSANRRRQIAAKTGEGPALDVCVEAFIIYSMFFHLIILFWDMSSSRRGVHRKIEFLSWTGVRSKKLTFCRFSCCRGHPKLGRKKTPKSCSAEWRKNAFKVSPSLCARLRAYIPRRDAAMKFKKVSASSRSFGGEWNVRKAFANRERWVSSCMII